MIKKKPPKPTYIRGQLETDKVYIWIKVWYCHTNIKIVKWFEEEIAKDEELVESIQYQLFRDKKRSNALDINAFRTEA